MENRHIEISKKAIKMALTTREEEIELKKIYKESGIKSAAVNIGGKMPTITQKIIENLLVASIKNGLVQDNRLENGIVVGAVREVLIQLQNQINGFNVGGKVSILREGNDISVAIYLNIGILHLTEIAIATAHRAIN